MPQILLTCILVMLASLVGGLTAWSKTHSFVEKNIPVLTSFAIGIFSVVAFTLFTEAGEHQGMQALLGWVLAGVGLGAVLPKLIPEFHHHHHPTDTSHTHSKKSAGRILLSDSLHNIADGVLITTSFIAGGVVGIGVALSVLIHELIQEMTEFFVLKQAGYSTNQALIRNFLVSSTVLIGSVGSFYFLETFEWLEPALLGLAAGSFLSVLLQDLIPTSYREIRKSGKGNIHFISIVLGVVLMLIVGKLGTHQHTHEEHHEGEEHEEGASR